MNERTVTRPTIGFLTWSSAVPTGGNVYDDRLMAALQAAGAHVHRHRVSGIWPAEADDHRSEVAAALRSFPILLVDSIIACAVPDLVTEAVQRGQPLTILLHSLLSTEIGLSGADQQRYRSLEATALRAAAQVVTTSQWAADDLRRRYGITTTTVARPGVDAVAPVPGSPSGRHLLCLGSLTSTKDQLGFVAALGRLADLEWSARLVGGDRVQPDYTAAVRRAVGQHRLEKRITITGPLSGEALDEVWTTTDLLVLPSRSETYGMVVVEALARGIPAIVTAQTGAVEALGGVDGDAPGAVVPPQDHAALAVVLQRWLTDGQTRDRWRAIARRRRETLDSWSDCAATVGRVLTSGVGAPQPLAMPGPLHDDEVDTGSGVVRGLLRQQAPRLAELSLSLLSTTGTDNAMYRLGPAYLVRMPRIPGAARGLAVEIAWLPRLVGQLPTAVPGLVHAGEPTDGYPYRWAILAWLDGTDAWTARFHDDWFGPDLGSDLADAVHALQAIPTSDAPRREPGSRGGPLSTLDDRVRWWLDRSAGLVDVASVTRAWDQCREATDYEAAPVLLHGDLIPGNVLIEHARLSALIDWGGLGAGDPALDLIPAWSVLNPTGAAAFRDRMAVDHETWLRARGFALEQALGGISYYTVRQHPLADVMRRTLERILARSVP